MKKHIKNENFNMDLIDLIERNYQITMTSDNFVLSNNPFKSYLSATSFNMFLTL